MNSYMQARSGLAVDLMEPTVAMIEPTDIAHGLARICRFNGHVLDFYSVAQHCCFVEDLMPHSNFRLKALALLHDAAEAYIGDMSSPVRRMLRASGTSAFDDAEDRLLEVIYKRFHVAPPTEAEHLMIRWADQSALLTERRDVLEPTTHDWSLYVDEGVQAQEKKISPWSIYNASQEYMKRLREIERHYGPAKSP